MLADTVAGHAVTPANSLAILDVYAAVRRLSDGVAAMPLVVYRKTADGRERADGPTAELLRRPAPSTTQASLVGTVVAHLALYGNCYLGKVRAPSGQVVQLVPLAPDRVVAEVRGGVPIWTYTDVTGRVQTLTSADVVHIKTMSLDGLVGLSPIRQAREQLGLAAALTDHAASFWANGASPGGLLKVPTGPNADEMAANLSKAWQARHGGTRNANRIAVVSGEVTFEGIGVPMRDAEWVESQRLSTVAIARLFGLPPWTLAADAGSSMTYSNVSEQLRSLVVGALRPYAAAIEQALSLDDDLCPTGSGLYVEHLADGLLRGDAKARAEVYAIALDPAKGWMSRDEVRRLENLPAEPQRTLPNA